MADEYFNIALDNCISRLAEGESLAEVLRDYPEFVADLRPLLESGMIVPELQVSDDEVAISQARVAERFEAALSANSVVHRSNRNWWRGLSSAAAILVMLLFANIALAQNSLPNDWNYGIKRFSESATILFLGNDDRFAERRINEAERLLDNQRMASITFEGEIIAIHEANFQIAQLDFPIEASPALLANLMLNQSVRVSAETTQDGRIIAQAIDILERDDTDAEIIVSPSPEITVTARPSEVIRPSATSTATDTATSRPSTTSTTTDTPRIRPSATDRPSETATLTETSTATNTLTHTPSPSIRPSETASRDENQAQQEANCVVSIPTGWIAYTIQGGDTLSALATRSGGSLEMIIRVNCIENPSLVPVGRTIYLPNPANSNPPTQATRTVPDNNEDSRPSEQPQATRPPVRPTATDTPARSR